MSTTSRLLLDLLAEQGVDVVFGVPGNHTIALYRDFESVGIRHITTRHEQAAAFMADGYARAAGRPGVCVLISGPGLLNAATSIAQALADSIPMLVITGVSAVEDLGMARGTLHELPDQRATALSLCRASHTLLEPDNLPEIIDRAFASFATSRPGPVHVEIPLNLMDAPVKNRASHQRVRYARRTISPPGADPTSIDRAAALLRESTAPLLLLGGGAINAAEPIVALAEQLDAPVLNTVNGKGICPANHPLAVGGSPSMASLKDALRAADTVLAIGTEMAETDYDLLMQGSLPEFRQLIRLDIDAEQLLIPVSPTVGITTDALIGAKALLAALEPHPAPGPAPEEGDEPTQGQIRAAELRRQITQEPHYHPEMQAFFAALQRAAPESILVGDSTRPTYYAAWQYQCLSPRCYFHSVSGFGTLGYALPAAFGAALATERPVLGLIGDGGIQFTLPELTTGAALELPVPIIVWHNDGYREIENSMRASNIPVDSTRILAPDFQAAASAHHVDYANPGTLAELEADIAVALSRARPTLIEVRESDFLSEPSGEWYQ